MKILVIRMGRIGDIMLTTPLVRCLKRQKPEAEIHYLTATAYGAVLQHNPYIDQLHLLQGDEAAMLNRLQAEHFEWVLDLQDDTFSRSLIKTCKLPSSTYRKLGFQRAVFTRLKWNIMPRDQHLADRFLEAAKPLGISNDGAGLDFIIPHTEEIKIGDIPASHQLGFIAVVIGSSRFSKRMPPIKLQELCRMIDHPVLLLGGKKDFDRGEDIASFDPVKVYNACGKFSLAESADLLRRSKLVISHDTGLMQIAAALKKPIITLWGSTTPSLKKGPYYGSDHLKNNPKPYEDLQVRHLWCRPCTTEGRQNCPQGHFKCMKKMPLDLIASQVRLWLQGKV